MIVLAIAFYKDVVSRLQLINVAEESIAMSGKHRVARVPGQSRVSQVCGAEDERFVARPLPDHSVKNDLWDGNPGESPAARAGRGGDGILSLSVGHQCATLLQPSRIS